MRRGFTVLELLVASLLLGMLTTILTMILNQSSIAWRTGMAMVSDLDEVRDSIATLREESDNAFLWKNKVYRHVGPWDLNGDLRYRSVAGESKGDVEFSAVDADYDVMAPNVVKTKVNDRTATWTAGQNVFNVGQGDAGSRGKTYIVNVMSAGPNREFDDWDDIWSFPDDFE